MAAIAMMSIEEVILPDDELMEDLDEAAEAGAGMSDEDILHMLDGERHVSIGFENFSTLERKRTTSLKYAKGEMDDMPSLPNRSKAVSTDIAEAIETVMPDLMDIFTGGEDVATIAPVSADDEERASQETDWVNYTAFQKLPGFLLLYTAIKDALLTDTGILYTYWQDEEAVEEEEVFGKTAPELEMAAESGVEIVSVQPAEPIMGEEGVEIPTFNAVLRRKYDKGQIRSEAVDPSNLTVAQDATLDLNKAVYFCIRSYPRAQALLDMGFDEELVAKLPAYTKRTTNENIELARDVAGETTSLVQSAEGSGPEGPDGKSLMRTVEVHKHFIRADIDGTGKSQLWKIETDSDCRVLLDKRRIDRTGVSVGTPFITTHRFYGQSLAEKLIEIQKIKTALLRLMLDSGYFAMNQRTEIAMDQANEHTISDLMRNEPLAPVRSRTGNAVRPLQSGALSFNVAQALEYVSTMGEQRTGIVRNAQGLNPDTLHDTARGAQALMAAAQKRVRMIARILAETLVKGWLLDIHALSRKHATRADKIRLRGKWVDIDPSTFGDRSDMVIEVGVGSGGKDMELAALGRVIDFQQKMIQSQIPDYAAMAGPQQVWNAVTRFATRSGFKAPEMFFANPEEIAAKKAQEAQMKQMQGIEEPPPPPDPAQMKIQGELELARQKHMDAMQMEAQKLQMSLQSQQQAAEAKVMSDREAQMLKAQQDQAHQQRMLEAEQARAMQDAEIRRYQIDQEIALKREQIQAELALNERLQMARIQAGVTGAGVIRSTDVNIGGEAGV